MLIPEFGKYAENMIFLSLAAYREARGEPDEVITGVMYSITNRVEHPGWWGWTVLDVVTCKDQYSSMTFQYDKQLTVFPKSKNPVWQKILILSEQVLDKKINNPIGLADSYFDISLPKISWPKWATDDKFIIQLNKIRFYQIKK